MDYQIDYNINSDEDNHVVINKNITHDNNLVILNLLKNTLNDLDKRVDFISKYSLELNNDINTDLLLIVSKIENVINHINHDIIMKSQINTDKSSFTNKQPVINKIKNIECEFN